MRCSQFIGHTKDVQDYLNKCTNMGQQGMVKGMFDEDIYPLSVFTDKNLQFWQEFEQYCLWSSGPMIFLGIRTPDGIIKGWTRKEELVSVEFDQIKGELYI